MGHMAERAQIVVKGIVQGVGFRPYVFNLAVSLGLTGYVTNTSEGVLIEVEGHHLPDFVRRLQDEAPPLSQITELSVVPLPPHGYEEFSIRQSRDIARGAPFTLVPPDMSICDACLRELLDPSDRRYLYPFINCTNCGPRYSITRSIPYDRPNTTMADFTMCRTCSREYDDPRDRRFHAQPNACPDCGPQVAFRVTNPVFKVHDRDSAVQAAIRLLKEGGIVAVKGLGGFHIACDATNDVAVKRLREKKRKSNKPFAVMAADIASIEQFCAVSERERDHLTSPRRPIVLLRKRTVSALSDAVSPNNKYIGCMLPYTPLHYLLFYHPFYSQANGGDPLFLALIMTSGNLSEEPIIHDNDQALNKLSGIADGFLLHNRDIFMRVDDSVSRVRRTPAAAEDGAASLSNRHHALQSFLRRSRGYAPDSILLRSDGPQVLGCGADLKNTFTLIKGKFAIPSQHIGDMENYETVGFFEEVLANLKAVYRAEPVALGHDLHPEYMSTKWAVAHGASRQMKTYAIQHHYAHIGSVMAENGLTGKTIGIAFDGTGYGIDGNLWGGEFLVADVEGFDRVGHLRYIPLPGGEAAIREPWKTAVSYLIEAGGADAWDLFQQAGFVRKYGKKALEQIMIVARSREFSPLSSGAGRLFDAVSALLGVCDHNTFEGEAAMALEFYTAEGIDDEYEIEFNQESGYTVVDFSPAILEIVRDLNRTSKEVIATKFHNTVSTVIRTMTHRICDRYGCRDVALGGGTFQNLYLLNSVADGLSREGMRVFVNQKVPCNDASVSLGQAYLVRERIKRG